MQDRMLWGKWRHNRATLVWRNVACVSKVTFLFSLFGWSLGYSKMFEPALAAEKERSLSTWTGLLRHTAVWVSAGFSVWYFATSSSGVMLSLQYFISAGFLTAWGNLCCLVFSLFELRTESESDNVLSGQNWANIKLASMCLPPPHIF